jgi:hypothetical protein
MELPEDSIYRTIAREGYVARSGNVARIALEREQGRNVAAVVTWERKPSEADKQELEQLIAAEANVTRGPDLEEGAGVVYEAMKAHLKR